MSKKPLQSSLLETSVAAQDEQQQEILSHLGLEALPTHETRWLPLERLEVSERHNVRVPASLVQSIKRFGVLQPPSVVRCSPPEEDEEHARYQVIAGRRRTEAARRARLTVLKVEVYAYSTPQLSALLALIENAQRSAAWRKEVADLRLLIEQGVGMTARELEACGFARAGLGERLKMAQLPAPFLDQIVSGTVSLEVARKLVRLTQGQLARVAQVAQEEPLTADLVKHALKAQISASLSSRPIEFPLWDAPSVSLMRGGPLTSEEQEAPRSLTELLAALHAFCRSPDYQRVAEAHLLIEALMQQLEAVERETTSPALVRVVEGKGTGE